MKLHERINLEETPPVTAKLYTALAHSARDADDSRHATMFYELGVKVNESLQLVFQLAILLLELARVRLHSGDCKGSIVAAEEAKSAFSRVRSRRGENECNLVLARAHRHLGQSDVSCNLLTEVVLQGGDSGLQNTSLTEVYFELGMAFAAQHDLEQAERWLEKAGQGEDVNCSLKSRVMIARAELLSQRGMMDEARSYLKAVSSALPCNGGFNLPDDIDLLLHLTRLWNQLFREQIECKSSKGILAAAAQKLRRLCERD